MPASLTPLKPPALIAAEEEAGVELVALEAGRSPQGLMATLQATNKHVDAYQTIVLGDPQQRDALVAKVYPNTRGRNARRFARILLGAGQKVEAALREQMQKRGDETQAARIVQLAQAWDLFHTPDGMAYVTFPGEGGEQQTWPLRCRVTRDRLEQVYFTTHGGVPGAQAVQDALGVLAGKARFAGPERPVFLRRPDSRAQLFDARQVRRDAGWSSMPDPVGGAKLL